MTSPAPPPARFRALRILAGTVSVVIGILMIAAVSVIGDCAAFGGRCPSQAPPLLEDDNFGMATIGGLLAVAVPVWLKRPGWRRIGYALLIGLPAAVLIGLIARDTASSL